MKTEKVTWVNSQGIKTTADILPIISQEKLEAVRKLFMSQVLPAHLSPISEWKNHWSPDPDRIEYYQNEKTAGDMPSIDEMVIHDAHVHLEKLSDSSFYMIAENDKHYWHFRIYSRSGRAKIEADVYEEENKLATDRKPSGQG